MSFNPMTTEMWSGACKQGNSAAVEALGEPRGNSPDS